jgi:hypothetical protein
MRKPRNYDEDLKALTAKAKQLKARKQSQLGELVEATGADALPIEELAGALLSIAAITDQRDGRHGANAAPPSFLASGPNRLLVRHWRQRATSSAARPAPAIAWPCNRRGMTHEPGR